MPESKPPSESLLAELTLDERREVWTQAMNETHGGNPSEALLKELIACLRKGQGSEEETEPTQEEETEPEPEQEEQPHGRKKRRAR